MKRGFLFVLLLLLLEVAVSAGEECGDAECEVRQFLEQQCGDSYVGQRLSRDVHTASTMRSIYNGLLRNGKQTTQDLKRWSAHIKGSDFIQHKVPALKTHITSDDKVTRRSLIEAQGVPPYALNAQLPHPLQQLQATVLQSVQQTASKLQQQQRLLRACIQRVDGLASGVSTILHVH